MDMSFAIPTKPESAWTLAVNEAFELVPAQPLLSASWLSLLKDRICVIGQRSADEAFHSLEIPCSQTLKLQATLEPWNPSCCIDFSGSPEPYPVVVQGFASSLQHRFSWPEAVSFAELDRVLTVLSRLAELAGYSPDQRLAWWRFGLLREPKGKERWVPTEAFSIPPGTKVILPPFHLRFEDIVMHFVPKGEVQPFIDVLGKPCICRKDEWPVIEARESSLRRVLKSQGLRDIHQVLEAPTLKEMEECLALIERSFHRLAYH